MLKKKVYDIGIILCYITVSVFFIISLFAFSTYINPNIAIDLFGINYQQFYGAAFFLQPALTLKAGTVGFLLIKFGLKKRLIWTWFVFLIYVTFVPVPNFAVQVKYNLFPFSLFVLGFGIPGVALTGPYIFDNEKT